MPDKRIGGRGCPRCGSHNTDTLRVKSGKRIAQWCLACEHRWIPCEPYCRGYVAHVDEEGRGAVLGCAKCEVPDYIAQMWPEAFRAVARLLQEKKFVELT